MSVAIGNWLKQPTTWIGITNLGAALLRFWQGELDAVDAWIQAVAGMSLIVTGTPVGDAMKVK